MYLRSWYSVPGSTSYTVPWKIGNTTEPSGPGRRSPPWTARVSIDSPFPSTSSSATLPPRESSQQRRDQYANDLGPSPVRAHPWLALGGRPLPRNRAAGERGQPVDGRGVVCDRL